MLSQPGELEGFGAFAPVVAAGRGGQVSFACDSGWAVMQNLIARGVIGDFRAPDVLRFGFTPLYIGEAEVDAAVAALRAVLDSSEWQRPEFMRRNAVT